MGLPALAFARVCSSDNSCDYGVDQERLRFRLRFNRKRNANVGFAHDCTSERLHWEFGHLRSGRCLVQFLEFP